MSNITSLLVSQSIRKELLVGGWCATEWLTGLGFVCLAVFNPHVICKWFCQQSIIGFFCNCLILELSGVACLFCFRIQQYNCPPTHTTQTSPESLLVLIWGIFLFHKFSNFTPPRRLVIWHGRLGASHKSKHCQVCTHCGPVLLPVV